MFLKYFKSFKRIVLVNYNCSLLFLAIISYSISVILTGFIVEVNYLELSNISENKGKKNISIKMIWEILTKPPH